ncbi:MAG: hypothetical protein JRI91_12155 [Deltaproteobacteria bacterium]|nr:hypothetical protein [Deltaproteobacteria bacterium]
MNKDANSLIEESINLELNVSDTYLLFHKLFPDDGDIWWDLAFEEKNHASIIQVGTNYLRLVDMRSQQKSIQTSGRFRGS